MKCIESECDKEACFDSPEHYCDFHWFRWFHEDYSVEELQQLYSESTDDSQQEWLDLLIYQREHAPNITD